jgi:hypothetical protein
MKPIKFCTFDERDLAKVPRFQPFSAIQKCIIFSVSFRSMVSCSDVLIDKDRVAVRVHDDKTGGACRRLVRFTLKRQPVRLQLTL